MLGGAFATGAKPFELISTVGFPQYDWASRVVLAFTWLEVLAVGAIYVFAAVRLRDAMWWRVLLSCVSPTSPRTLLC